MKLNKAQKKRLMGVADGYQNNLIDYFLQEMFEVSEVEAILKKPVSMGSKTINDVANLLIGEIFRLD